MLESLKGVGFGFNFIAVPKMYTDNKTF